MLYTTSPTSTQYQLSYTGESATQTPTVNEEPDRTIGWGLWVCKVH